MVYLARPEHLVKQDPEDHLAMMGPEVIPDRKVKLDSKEHPVFRVSFFSLNNFAKLHDMHFVANSC